MWKKINRIEFLTLRAGCPKYLHVGGTCLWYTPKGTTLVKQDNSDTYYKWEDVENDQKKA